MRYKTIGTGGFAGAVAIAIVLAIIYYITGGSGPVSGNMGLCLPSPDQWPIPVEWSWIINMALIVGSGTALIFFNKGYSLIQNADMVFPSMFVILTATNPWAGGQLDSSSLMVIINIICLATIFSCYKSRNATQEVFFVATMLGVGSMFQYAFLFFIPAYLLIALMMKCLHFKEIIAFGMGVVAPYWIAVGMGLVPLDQFHVPQFTNLFENLSSGSDLLIGALNIGLTALVGIILALNNAVKLYAGNTRRRLYNNAIAVIGLICIAGMALDFHNLPTYLATFYMTAAMQIANTFALWNIPKSRYWIGSVTAVYVILFLIMIF